MAKKKEEKTNVMRILDKAKISYTPYFYDHEDGKIDGVAVATKLGQPLGRGLKTLGSSRWSRSSKPWSPKGPITITISSWCLLRLSST